MILSNWALGSLQIGTNTIVRIDDPFTYSGTNAALYLNSLILNPGSLLIIGPHVQVYFVASNGWNASQVDLVGNPSDLNSISGIHQLMVIPEPNVLVLWLSGLATVIAARRRAKKLR